MLGRFLPPMLRRLLAHLTYTGVTDDPMDLALTELPDLRLELTELPALDLALTELPDLTLNLSERNL